ncbi:PKD domain-containing protein [Rhizobium johnstonii]|uniref:PKD domain-containing protein n=1 Tax=Rhizobium johnstonii TaxID=3019933 RepID=UPI003F969BF9
MATYAWDFGDATTGSGVNPSHDYATAGAKSVKLAVGLTFAGGAIVTELVATAVAAGVPLSVTVTVTV